MFKFFSFLCNFILFVIFCLFHFNFYRYEFVNLLSYIYFSLFMWQVCGHAEQLARNCRDTAKLMGDVGVSMEGTRSFILSLALALPHFFFLLLFLVLLDLFILFLLFFLLFFFLIFFFIYFMDWSLFFMLSLSFIFILLYLFPLSSSFASFSFIITLLPLPPPPQSPPLLLLFISSFV